MPGGQGRQSAAPNALSIAVQNGDLLEAQRLVENGDDVNCQDEHGMAPLHWAAQNGHREIIKLLLQHGANPRLEDSRNLTAHAIARACGKTRVLHLLSASVAVEQETPPMIVAAATGGLDAMTRLLGAGASPNCRDHEGMTPLHWAAQNGHLDTVAVLIAHHANMDAKSTRRHTPLMLAAYHGQANVVRLLMAAQADCNLTDRNGRTAAELARLRGHRQIANVLERLTGNNASRGR